MEVYMAIASRRFDDHRGLIRIRLRSPLAIVDQGLQPTDLDNSGSEATSLKTAVQGGCLFR